VAVRICTSVIATSRASTVEPFHCLFGLPSRVNVSRFVGRFRSDTFQLSCPADRFVVATPTEPAE
jgi:hypothetical protein